MGKLRAVVIGLIVLSGTMSGMIVFGSSLFNQYDSSVQDSKQINKLRSVANSTQRTTQSQLAEGRTQAGNIGGFIGESVFLVRSVFQGIMVAFDAAFQVPVIAATFIGMTGLPSWLEAVINSVIWAIVLFTIYSAYRGYEV